MTAMWDYGDDAEWEPQWMLGANFLDQVAGKDRVKRWGDSLGGPGQSSQVRLAKVLRLRAAIASGAYQVRLDDLAGCMMRGAFAEIGGAGPCSL